MATTHSEFFSIFIFLNFFGLINYSIVNFFLFSIFSPFSNYRTLKPLIFFPFQFFFSFSNIINTNFLEKMYNIDYFYMHYNYIFLFYRSVKIKKPLVRSCNSVHIFIFIILFTCFTFVFKLHYFLMYLFIYSVTSLDYYALFDLVIYLVMNLLFFGKHKNRVYITYFYYYLFVYMHSYLYIYLLFEVTNNYYYYHLIILTNYLFENEHTLTQTK